MLSSAPNKDKFFKAFGCSIDKTSIPTNFSLMADGEPHPLCLLAAEELQLYIKNQTEWQHNFGLSDNEGRIIGKMFGVLVVKTQQNEIGYLAAFSGKLAGGNHHSKFVPPVFDSLSDTSFLNTGMVELTRINKEIKDLEKIKPVDYIDQIAILKETRKNNSSSLQNLLFDQYHFLNKAGEEKSLTDIFKKASYKNPPSGAGECAGPKLLQYAFQHNMNPLAIAEFWWGQSPKSATWKHGHYYPCCREKCEPVLAHMLSGIDH